ncbi:MAG: hypothetical protein KC621_18060 [Myxococcales bacterium]|nr:hypothetical protein [Myxococcales bacterium]
MLLLVSSFTAFAANGPLEVGFRDVSFVDGSRGQVRGRVYYPATVAGERAPADTSQGPHPLVAMMHGWLGQPFMYDGISEEIASWGYVVASTGTEIGPFLNMDVFARDTVALLHHVDDASGTAGDPLQGTVAAGDWGALGHSMGGATLAELVDIEPRVRTIVAFMPYQGDAGYYDQLARYDGAALILSGSDDGTAPPAMQDRWFDSLDSTSRGLLLRMNGFGHQAVTDLADDEGSVPKADQFDAVAALSSLFVRAELGGEEDLYADLFALSATLPGDRRSSSHVPATWATLDGSDVQVGVLGVGTDTTQVWMGTGPGATDDLGMDGAELQDESPMVDGFAIRSLPVPWTDGLLLQARTGGALGRVITLVEPVPPIEDTGLPADTGDTGLGTDPGTGTTTDPTSGTTTDPTGTTGTTTPSGTTDGEPPKQGGCDSTGGAPAGLGALLLLALAGRRRR